MEKKTVGTGLTEKTILTYSLAEVVRYARDNKDFLGSVLTTYPELLLSWRKWAIDVLKRADLPTEDKEIVITANGWEYWSDVDQAKFDRPTRIIRALDYSNEEEEATLEWYASRILRLVNQEIARLHPKRRRARTERTRLTGEVRRIADLVSRGSAFQLGSFVERVRWKFRYEKAALRGLVHMDSWPARQAASVQARKAQGKNTEKRIEALLNDVIKKSSKSLVGSSFSEIIRRMRRHSPTTAQQFSDSTLRRHLKVILSRRRAATR